MAHTGDENVELVETQRETRATKAKRGSSRDQLSTLEDKVERLEDGVRDAGERLDVVDGHLSELESKGDEFKDDVNIAFNKVMKDVEKGASPKLSGSLSTNKQNKSLIASMERYKSLTLLNLCGLSLELSPELELSSEFSSWIRAGEGGGVMFCGMSTTCGGSHLALPQNTERN
ncbi:hypothetical protein V6N11_048016 [Hibiscus sabdariffa]|uniref:Uncharacterized protein n=2 Tax=Hibiscus sabdariffa TaxID=183260 RepID=A0ABR2AL09_9ROSI